MRRATQRKLQLWLGTGALALSALLVLINVWVWRQLKKGYDVWK